MKKYKVILTESEMRKLNEVRRNDDYITVDEINRNNYEKYIGKKVNVKGNVLLYDLGLKELPITFGKVDGKFNCSYNKLTSLKGCPYKVGRSFSCSHNHLTFLEDCPSKVGGYFSCSNNELTSLKGCPSEADYFWCSHNSLKSLEGCPSKVGRDFNCSHNSLKSLKGCPSKVGRDFNCSNNKKQFTKDEVESLCEVFGKIRV